MSRTAITPHTPVGPYPASVGALALNIAETAGDSSNGNYVANMTGREVVVLRNSDSGPQTVTFTSAPDEKGRTNDITTYSIGAGLVAYFSFRGGTTGWQQSNGQLYINVSDATVKITVLQFPN